MAKQLPQMELYCEIGKAMCRRAEKGAAVRFIRQAKKYLYLEKVTPTILNDTVLLDRPEWCGFFILEKCTLYMDKC